MTAIPRPIVATFHPKVGKVSREGNPGDRVEFSHALTGKQLGVVTVKAGGKFESWFLWE